MYAPSILASLTVQVFFNEACICLVMKLVKGSRTRRVAATTFRIATTLASYLVALDINEACVFAKPACCVLESSVFASFLQVVTRSSDLRTISKHSVNGAPHGLGTRTFFMRTRLGRRSSSRRRPTSSRLTSMRLLKGSPKPKTKSAIA